MQLRAKVFAMAALAVVGMSVLALGIAAAVQAGSHDAPDREARQQLAQVRQATTKYQDFQQACDDGYTALFGYVPGMGQHFWNGESIGDGADADFTNPQVLVYVPRGKEGKERMQLVAAEYLAEAGSVPDELFSGVGPDTWDFVPPIPPVGKHGLHAWVWLGNPDGVFNATNPVVPPPPDADPVTCP